MSPEPAEKPARPPKLSREAYRSGTLVSLMRLRWFIRLRWVFVALAFAVLVAERFLMPESHRPWQVGMLIGGVAAINVVWTIVSRLLRVRSQVPQTDEELTIRTAQVFANAQVAIDLLLLTLILRFTGGIESPLMMFYVFHIAISALLLRKSQAILQAAWAVLLYVSVAAGELTGWLTPHFVLLPTLTSPGWYANQHFVVVGVLVHACGVFGVLYFTLQIAARLDKRDRQLLAAYEALHRSKTAIQDLQVRRSRFMQTAAHQLKSPLAVIQTLATLIHDKIVPPEGIPATTAKIVRRCRDGIVQVTELLTLARVEEADPQRHYRARTDVGEVVRKLHRHYAPLAKEKDVRLTCRAPADRDFHVHIDPKDAGDAIGNLIDNAIKYTPGPGLVTVKVARIRERKTTPGPTGLAKDDYAGYVYVCVRDTGIGIEPGMLSNDGENTAGTVFDAFRRGNNALAAGIPGTGLGLSIVREIVEQVGGRIAVHSRPGHGSTFTIVFPAEREPAVDSAIRDTRASQIVIDRSQHSRSTTA